MIKIIMIIMIKNHNYKNSIVSPTSENYTDFKQEANRP